ncbi:MAG TPA: biotin carboxylase N-terminal domain-containing protein [Candidatus Limnocylindrales bacterium]|nr:biotin carboxylase N-terminal domain-containing protein [Candidatus Limnocylindrales bacterium]
MIPKGASPFAPIAIRRVFVANRGEIARRIERTTHRLGIEAVLPPTEGEDAVNLLDVDAVVAAARAADADALHPGFGFLAESPDLAAAVQAAGIRWVGPPPEAIAAMGDKAAARRLAAGLGIPVLPGYDEPDQSDASLEAAVGRIGLPVLVKPAAGGGGKGMRVVRTLPDLPSALAAARREAAAAFGDDRLILERLVEGGRHVEVQVLSDAHGHGVHLGERDCSIQRRHQKVLEETPSPAVTPSLRRAITEAALTLARAVGYVSAGTVELLVDEDGSFHFLEMNTRLQVEHPVTELVTGLDLVEQQLRVAAGEPLGLDQAELDVRRRGHAVEVRLYAEDAEQGFLPQTGRVVELAWPEGPGVRVDAGIDAGDVVSGRFDPMLAKVIAHGDNRGEALDRLADALDRTVVIGVVTNLRFLRWLVRQPVVRAGDARTDTLDRIWPPAGWEPPTLGEAVWAAAAGALGHTALAGDVWAGGWRMNAAPRLRLTTDEREEVRLVALPAVARDGARPGRAIVVDGVAYVDVEGRSVAFRLAPPPDEGAASAGAGGHRGGTGDRLTAPMPGVVIGLHVEVGSEVAAGAPVATLEAMKMEHVVVAPHAGAVTALEARVGDQVTRGQLLAVVEPSPYSPTAGGTAAS